MGDVSLIIALLALVAPTLVKAFALPAVRILLTGWTKLHTAMAPEPQRSDIRQQTESDFHDQGQQLLGDGYHPAEAATRIFFRMLVHVPSDIVAAISYVPATLARRLENVAQAIRTRGTPKLAIIAVGLFAFMNTGALLSDSTPLWHELVKANAAAAAAVILTHYQNHTWAKRVMAGAICATLAGVVALLAWVTIENRLYESPHFTASVILLACAILPVMLCAVVASNACRIRLFKGRWWPVFFVWLAIASVSITSAVLLDYQILLIAWATPAFALTGLMIMLTVFCGGAALVFLGISREIRHHDLGLQRRTAPDEVTPRRWNCRSPNTALLRSRFHMLPVPPRVPQPRAATLASANTISATS